MRTTRPRDVLYDAWTQTWGEPVTRTERGRLNRALKELREVGATPDQVTRALRNYDAEFKGCARSPQGVTGNWRLLTTSRLLRDRSRSGDTSCPHGVSYFERCAQCIEEAG